jgi:hypothetical protein
MNFFFLNSEDRQKAKILLDIGFCFVERLDKQDFWAFSFGFEHIGTCYGVRVTTEGSPIVNAVLGDCLFSFCAEPSAYEDPLLQELAADPKKLFDEIKSRLKSLNKELKQVRPKQLSLM